MSQTTTTNSQWPHNNNPHDDTASRDNDKERAHPRRPQAPWRLRDLHLVGMAKLPIQSASTRALFGMYRVTERCRYIASATIAHRRGQRGSGEPRHYVLHSAAQGKSVPHTFHTSHPRTVANHAPRNTGRGRGKAVKVYSAQQAKETGPERDSPSLGWSRSVTPLSDLGRSPSWTVEVDGSACQRRSPLERTALEVGYRELQEIKTPQVWQV